MGATIASSGGVNASQAFGYDRANRLTASSESGSWTRNYGYDEWGNGWVTLNSIVPLDPRTPVGSSNFDTKNRLNIDGAVYDNGATAGPGNQTAIAGFSNAYDAENRLLTSALGGVTTTYTYDGDGRRVQKATGGSTTVYVYDAAGQLAAEYDTPVPAALCATCYLTADHLGSTRMMTDGTTGAPVAFHDYLPFGEEIQAGIGGRGALYDLADPKQKFTGKERDVETGLDYFGARYFASPQGRWTIPDWSGRAEALPYAKLPDPQTLNLYAYVRNNPLSNRDLDGHGDGCNFFQWVVGSCNKGDNPETHPQTAKALDKLRDSAGVKVTGGLGKKLEFGEVKIRIVASVTSEARLDGTSSSTLQGTVGASVGGVGGQGNANAAFGKNGEFVNPLENLGANAKVTASGSHSNETTNTAALGTDGRVSLGIGADLGIAQVGVQVTAAAGAVADVISSFAREVQQDYNDVKGFITGDTADSHCYGVACP